MEPFNNYHFKVGTINCVAISDGTETVALESVFKDAPPEQLRQALLEGGNSTQRRERSLT